MKKFASKELKNAIRRAMNRTQRRSLDEGEIFSVRVHRFGRPLKRWGDDELCEMQNVAIIRVRGRNCEILSNSLTSRAWSYNTERAFEDACRALDYYTYGGPDEFEILIGGEKGKAHRNGRWMVKYREYYGEDNKFWIPAEKITKKYGDAKKFANLYGGKVEKFAW